MATAQTETILVLEADILVRNALAEYLRGCGYRVLEVSNAGQARQVLEASDAKVDLFFASPGDNPEAAVALSDWARTDHPNVEVVLAGDLGEAGAALARPYDHQQVLGRIYQLLAARRRGDPVA